MSRPSSDQFGPLVALMAEPGSPVSAATATAAAAAAAAPPPFYLMVNDCRDILQSFKKPSLFHEDGHGATLWLHTREVLGIYCQRPRPITFTFQLEGVSLKSLLGRSHAKSWEAADAHLEFAGMPLC